MDLSSKIGKLRLALVSLVPLRLKIIARQYLNKDKLASLARSKQRFRGKRKLRKQLPFASLHPRGVNLVAYIRAEMGLGVVARGMAAALESVKIRFNVINIERGNPSRHSDLSWTHKEVSSSRYDITVVCVNPDNSLHLRTLAPTNVLGKRYVIGTWFWELPEMPDEWLTEFEYIDEIWAASRFIRDAVSLKAPVPVVRVPPVVRLSQTRLFSRSELGLPERRYLFLAMFDTNSILERKNPLGVLSAF